MNGIDTNVLVRYLVADDPLQSAKAKRHMESCTNYVNCIVLCETVWVLESAYDFDRSKIADTLERILSTHEIEVEDAEMALAALQDYRRASAGFTDCLIGRRNASHGCDQTVTFDKRAKGAWRFKIL
jgi:predicted nucleic-acid-binding protein